MTKQDNQLTALIKTIPGLSLGQQLRYHQEIEKVFASRLSEALKAKEKQMISEGWVLTTPYDNISTCKLLEKI
jgi:hypothetical protein